MTYIRIRKNKNLYDKGIDEKEMFRKIQIVR